MDNTRSQQITLTRTREIDEQWKPILSKTVEDLQHWLDSRTLCTANH
ncbi:hypothetical protein PHMEG_00012916 [Phytophthora megakarya]|uniref:Uncharacterized protein n=1 Tax=Phytophthora megakarya TaxID=4795 RepID=A0A225W807_9STRA|nr:hypothetical protein PHMEG_00012916 [Phytophthora megakarya]